MHIEQSDFHDQLVRGLTHKMNNILSLFHGYLGLLMDDKKLDPGTIAGLGRIKDGARAASELMDRTKALARPSSIVWREVNIGDLLNSMRSPFEEIAGPAVNVRIEVPEGLPVVWADIARLKMAITEIFRNACEASVDGGLVKIEARAECQLSRVPSSSGKASQPITWVSINVTDYGTGIPVELAEKIFQPFFTTRQKQNSTGLGLTVAMGLIQQFGGTIRFQSKQGLTTFRLLLPSRSGQV
jgi:two-component system, cell cycle sensor histidine kinase and response regulator CckA